MRGVDKSREDCQLLQNMTQGVADVVVQLELRVIDTLEVMVTEDIDELLATAD